MKPLKIEVAPGEIFDRYSILRLKAARILETTKNEVVSRELKQIRPTVDYLYEISREPAKLEALYHQLFAANETLWVVEDELRLCEKQSVFDQRFIQLARTVYKTNDQRAELKRQISMSFNADVYEVKSYA